MDKLVLKGCGTALVTPFRDGEVDYQAYRAIVRRQVEAGIDFLLPLGTTGETPCLTDEEKVEIFKITKEEAQGLPIVVGCGTNSLAGTIRNMKVLEPYSPDAFLVVVPYYNKPTQEGMYEYFKAVAAATELPVIMYNVPGRTGVNMMPDTALRLANDVCNIMGIKEATGNYFQALALIKHAPVGFQVICGDDDLTYSMLRAGACGVFSVASNVAPKRLVEMTHAVLDGQMDKAERINNALKELYRVCFIESNPIPVKTALFQMGLCRNEFRLPLCPASKSSAEKVAECLEELGVNLQ